MIAGLSQRDITALFSEIENHYRDNPLDWFANEVFTADEATQKKMPWMDKAYVRDLIRVFQNERMVAIPKSRRQFASWTCAGWAVYNARFFPSNAIFIQSETEDKAAYITDKRCMFIEDNLATPELKLKYHPIRTNKGLVGRITYDKTGSYIWAIPQGASVIRTYTFSILIMDESEFQAEGPDALAASMPTVEKNAQIIILSSSNGPTGILADICRGAGFYKWSGRN